MNFGIKLLLFLFLLILGVLSCSKQEENQLIQDEVFDTIVSEAYEIFSQKPFDTFLNDELKELIAKPSLSKDELKRMEDLSNVTLNKVLAQSVSLKVAYNDMFKFGLSQQQLKDELLKSGMRIKAKFIANEVESRACWICNEKACEKAIDLHAQPSLFYLGLLGMIVHC